MLLYLANIMLLSYATVDFHLFYDVAVDMQIWALLTRSKCRASDTRVTVKVLGSLVQLLTAMVIMTNMHNYMDFVYWWFRHAVTWRLGFIYRTDFHHHCNIKMWNLPIWNHVSNRNYPITAVVSLACPHNHRYVMDYTCCCFVPHAPSHHRKP